MKCSKKDLLPLFKKNYLGPFLYFFKNAIFNWKKGKKDIFQTFSKWETPCFPEGGGENFSIFPRTYMEVFFVFKLFKVGGTVMKSTVVNTSKEMMAYSDFPPPEDWPNFMHHSYVQKYLRLYAEHFSLIKYIHLNSEVKSVNHLNSI